MQVEHQQQQLQQDDHIQHIQTAELIPDLNEDPIEEA